MSPDDRIRIKHIVFTELEGDFKPLGRAKAAQYVSLDSGCFRACVEFHGREASTFFGFALWPWASRGGNYRCARTTTI